MELSRRSFIVGVLAAFVAERTAPPVATKPEPPRAAEVSSGLSWDDSASTPLADIRAAKRMIEQQTGFVPNIVVFGPLAWAAMLQRYGIEDAEAREVAAGIGLDVSVYAA